MGECGRFFDKSGGSKTSTRLTIIGLFILSTGTAPGNFDAVVHNADLTKSYAEFRYFVIGEIQRQIDAGVECSLSRNVDFKLH